jgi:hypothetical protein
VRHGRRHAAPEPAVHVVRRRGALMSGQAAAESDADRMRQLFAPGADAVLRLFLWAFFVLILGGGVMLYAWAHGDLIGNVGVAPAQPVPFSHKHHVAELGIDCRFCHTTVQTQATAGLPPTYTCMTCHSQIWTTAPMLAPVRASLADDRPLHWTRVNRLPDYVYFNHSIHIAKGIGCSDCHGAVDTMNLTYPAKSFRMEFCIDCHRAPQNAVRPHAEVWNMHWSPPADQARVGAALVRQYHIAPASRLTDCSICHR